VDLVATEFGTGLDAVAFDGMITRGSATARFVFFAPVAFRDGSPKLALPSVTGIGGRLDASAPSPSGLSEPAAAPGVSTFVAAAVSVP
jgi:hypothetical protein